MKILLLSRQTFSTYNVFINDDKFQVINFPVFLVKTSSVYGLNNGFY